MNRIISWFIHNPVASNLLMCVLVAGGLVSLPAIHLEEVPSIDAVFIRVSDGVVQIRTKKDMELTDQALKEAVKKSGFTLTEIERVER